MALPPRALHMPRLGETPMIAACRTGSAYHVSMFLTSGSDVNLTDRDGRTPLYAAADAGHTSIVTMLLQHPGTALDVQINTTGETALMAACRNGHREIAQALLDVYCQANTLDNSGKDALSLACIHGRREIILALLAYPMIAVNRNDRTSPLHFAVVSGNLKVVRLLLKKATNIQLNLGDLGGNTPLHLACKFGFDDITDTLLDFGADINDKNRLHETPLHLACTFNRGTVTKILLDRNARVNVTNSNNMTPLLVALNNSSRDSVQELVKCPNINLDCEDAQHRTALMIACEKNQEGLVKALVEAGADVNIAGPLGYTPLLRATKEGNVSIVSILLQSRNIRISDTDDSGRTALNYACEYPCLPMAQELIRLGADVNWVGEIRRTPLVEASLRGHRGLVKLLLSVSNCLVDKMTDTEDTALHVACLYGHEEVVKLLLKHRANADLANLKNRMTSLHMAVHSGCLTLVKTFAKTTTLTNARDFDGKTALYFACKLGHPKIVKALLKRGADGNLADYIGKTPLMKASEGGHEGIVSTLLKAGVSVADADDVYGQTALHLAAGSGHIQCVRLLLKSGASVNVRNKRGRSPFLVANANRHENVRLLMLRESEVIR